MVTMILLVQCTSSSESSLQGVGVEGGANYVTPL